MTTMDPIVVEVRAAGAGDPPPDERPLLASFMSDHRFSIGDLVTIDDGRTLSVVAATTTTAAGQVAQQLFV